MLKQGVKTINAEFIETRALSQLFFCSIQTLCNLVPIALSLFDINVKKQKNLGDDFGPYTFIQDLY